MGTWSALIGWWKSWIVICELGFQDLQPANMPQVKYQLFDNVCQTKEDTVGGGLFKSGEHKTLYKIQKRVD